MGSSKEDFTRQEMLHTALDFLTAQSRQGKFTCDISADPNMGSPVQSQPEIASSMLVLGTALRAVSSPLQVQIVNYVMSQIDNDVFHFFEDPTVLPTDVDTTSYGLSVLHSLGKISDEHLKRVTDKITSSYDENGIVQIYFNPCQRPNRIDATATANIMFLMRLANRRGDYVDSENWVMEMLESKKYRNGSRYYHSPDTFLYFLARACKFDDLKERFADQTAFELQSRIGTTRSPLDLAMRVTTAKRLGVDNYQEENELQNMQRTDGSFPSDAIYHYGSTAGYFGSAIISTAFAVEALATQCVPT